MKKIICTMLVISFVLSAFATLPATASENVTIHQPGFATVLQVIDGETLRVRPHGTQDTALVRLVGVNTRNNPEAVAFLNDQVMGRLVSLSFDAFSARQADRHNLMVVTVGDVNINRELMNRTGAVQRSGQGSPAVSAAHLGGPFHRDGRTFFFMNNRFYEYRDGVYIPTHEWFAIDEGWGQPWGNVWDDHWNWDPIWGNPWDNNWGGNPFFDFYSFHGFHPDFYFTFDGGRTNHFANMPIITDPFNVNNNFSGSPHISWTPRLNVNTASADDIANNLVGVSFSLAVNITRRRDDRGHFNTVAQLREVPGMTAEIFDRNAGFISVVTNINTATRQELRTLINITESDIDEILDYRRSQRFRNIAELHEEGLIDRDTFDDNRRFLSVSDVTRVN